MRTRLGRVLAVLGAASLLSACGGGADVPQSRPTPTADAIRVGAFNFDESRLVAELYAQALQAEDYPVGPVMELGSRETVEPALEHGRVDIVPEYTGSALSFLRRDPAAASADEARTHAELVEAFSERGVTVGAPAPAQNQNAFAVTEQTAAEHQLRTLSDLARVADEMVLGGPPECPQRHTCLGGLRDVYRMDFARFLRLEQTTHVSAALAAGEIDVGLLFTTDPAVLTNDFVVLDDDRGLQPAENLVPVVRDAVLRRHGEGVVEVLDSVSAELTTPRLAQLNFSAARSSTPVQVLAREWLADRHITP